MAVWAEADCAGDDEIVILFLLHVRQRPVHARGMNWVAAAWRNTAAISARVSKGAEYYPNNFRNGTIWNHMRGQRFTFGPFLLNLDNGTHLRKGEHVAVGRRGILLLVAFLKRQGEIVTKAELMDAAWPGAAVEESNLSVQIARCCETPSVLRPMAKSGSAPFRA